MTRIPGSVVTFYSYKGGVGRTLCLANVAAALAHNGFRVLLVDFDLNAPGLHAFPEFSERLLAAVDNQPCRDDDPPRGGILDLVCRQVAHVDEGKEGFAVEPADSRAWIVADVWPPESNGARHGGTIACLPGGRTSFAAIARLNEVGWMRFLLDYKGMEYFLRLRDEVWRADYDFVLLDSRPGATDYLHFCLGGMPDIAVVVSGLNKQNLDGLQEAFRAVRDVTRVRSQELVVLMALSPVPAGDIEILGPRLREAEETFRALGGRSGDGIRLVGEPFRLPYLSTLAVRERLVVPSARQPAVMSPYVRLAESIARQRFAVVDLLCNEAIKEGNTGLAHAGASLDSARSHAEALGYLYGRVCVAKLEGQRLAFMEDVEEAKNQFEVAIAVARERRGLAPGDEWERAPHCDGGHWRVELEALVFRARMLGARALRGTAEAPKREASAAYRSALSFLERFGQLDPADLFADRDREAYAQERDATRAGCLLDLIDLEEKLRPAAAPVDDLLQDVANAESLFRPLGALAAALPHAARIASLRSTLGRRLHASR